MRQMFLQPTASVELELESSECALNWQRCFGFLGISDMKKEEVHMVSKTGGTRLKMQQLLMFLTLMTVL